MKEIDLIKYETHSINFSGEAVGLPYAKECSIEFTKKISSEMATMEVVNPDTGQVVGKVNVAYGDNELKQARKNGSQIIYATIVIENQLNDIIANYLFDEFTPKRDFFVNQILSASHIEYSSKKALVLEILDNLNFFGTASSLNQKRVNNINKKKNEFDKLLKQAMIYRNAFAHGQLKYEESQGCLLQYYSGGHKRFVLNEVFWDKIENEYNSLNATLQDIVKFVRSPV